MAEIRVAIDGMGGDHAPAEIVKGVAQAAELFPSSRLLLTGPVEALEGELEKLGPKANIEVVSAPEVIEMGEEASKALRAKPNSSISVGTRLVKEGKADAFVSAGNTGAAMASASLTFGRIPGVKRPAIAVPVETLYGRFLLLDAGANADNKPEHLLQFAKMGSVYAERVLGIKDAKVGLLNIGAEEAKGNELTKAAYDLLSASDVKFVGNVEARSIFFGGTDVVVTDGFTGNMVLKVIEGVVGSISSYLKASVEGSSRMKAGAWLMMPALKELRAKGDYEEYGGEPLLGLNGVCIISHGSSHGKAIRNAIKVAVKTVEEDVAGEIARGMKGE